ncbi:type III secretion system invasion protein IagB, partial [Salmonella enterica subsp. enterica serovar Enteritidis]|nr:type III secretion system invasion protein IagB [Salmonella enterica subsp. enterica serovar Enteritidis]
MPEAKQLNDYVTTLTNIQVGVARFSQWGTCGGDMHYFFIIVIWLLSINTAWADCWLQAEKMFNIESELLYAIAQQESAMKPGAIGHNRDGSTDLGLMQINSFHMKRLKKMGISEKQLLQDPCISVIVGASILSDMMKIYGYSWEA